MRIRPFAYVIILSFLSLSLFSCSGHKLNTNTQSEISDDEKIQLWNAAQAMVENAESRKVEIADVCRSKIDNHFNLVAGRIPAFTSEVLSLRSKYHLVNYKIREYINSKSKKNKRTNRAANSFNREITAKFNTMVMSPNNLQAEVEAALNCYMKGAIEVDHTTIYDINQKIINTHRLKQIDYNSIFQEDEGLDTFINKKLLGNKVPDKVVDFNSERMIRYIGVRLVVNVTEQMVIRAGLISGGVALSPETLGLSFLACSGIDQIWSMIAQPEKRLTASLTKEMDDLKSLIIHGNKELLGYTGTVDNINELRKGKIDSAINVAIYNNKLSIP